MNHLVLTTITIAAVLLVGCGRKVDIWEAAYDGNIEAVKHHLDAGVDVNVKDEVGGTPLHAAAGGYKEIVELLIANGADLNAKDKDGRIALHLAANWGRKEIVELLITNGTEVNTNDNAGKTPIDWANVRSQSETADLHRKHGGKTAEELKAEGK